MLEQIQAELARVSASEMCVAFDSEFEPQAGELLMVESREAYWHLLPEHFLTLLVALPDGAGVGEVHRAIEAHGPAVWHGPAPIDSRDAANGS